jgi:hypothetical protein
MPSRRISFVDFWNIPPMTRTLPAALTVLSGKVAYGLYTIIVRNGRSCRRQVTSGLRAARTVRAINATGRAGPNCRKMIPGSINNLKQDYGFSLQGAGRE